MKHFPVRKGLFSRITGAVRAVDGVDLTLEAGQTLVHLDPNDAQVAYDQAVQALLFGHDTQLLRDKRVITAQAIGGIFSPKMGQANSAASAGTK